MHPVVKEDLEYITSAKIPWGDLEGKNILIAGANGFLPAYMIETILFLNDHRFKNKARVFALARNNESMLVRFSGYADRKDLVFIIQDVCTAIKMSEKMDFIIHAASQPSPKLYGIDPVGVILANTIGTANLLTLAVDHKSQGFMFFSSSEVYGEVTPAQTPIKEDSFGVVNPALIRSCNAESKRAGENMSVSWGYQYGVPIKIVRPFHTYGPGIRLDDGRVFADFVSDIVHRRDIIIKGDGSAIRAFCYLSDAVIGFFTVLLKGENAQAYNVGNPQEEISVSDLAYMLVALFPEKKLKVKFDMQSQDEGYLKSAISRNCPDTDKLISLGWKARYSLQEGFKRMVDSYEPY